MKSSFLYIHALILQYSVRARQLSSSCLCASETTSGKREDGVGRGQLANQRTETQTDHVDRGILLLFCRNGLTDRPASSRPVIARAYYSADKAIVHAG